jgi:chemotaxis protein MotB
LQFLGRKIAVFIGFFYRSDDFLISFLIFVLEIIGKNNLLTCKRMKKFFYGVVIILILCTSCVTKKKYLLAENGRLEALNLIDLLNDNLGSCEDENDKQSLRIQKLIADTTELGKSIRYCQSMLTSNISEKEKLSAMLDQEMSELRKKEQTINELQDMIRAQNERVQALLNSVKNALLGFSSDELSVHEKDGKVYVAMSDKLLFQSGSALVDKRGKEALAKLATVLKAQTDIDVMIEGHTDNKPINTVQFKDNWDLSVIRATSVVRILTKDYGIQPLQIQPSGRGEYLPVATNETAEGRSRNRRTEIIISPKLEKLFDLLR